MSTAPRVLRPGEAVGILDLGSSASTGLAVGLTSASACPDVVALLVGDDSKVRSDDDLVFYNNPASTDGSVTWAGQVGATEWIRITPETVAADVAKVVFGCAAGVLDSTVASPLTLTVTDAAGHALASAAFTAESDVHAMILFEVYRRHGQWRVRLLAQGYAGGLAALVTEFGVDVEESAPPAPTPAAPAPVAWPPDPQWQPSSHPAQQGSVGQPSEYRQMAPLTPPNARPGGNPYPPQPGPPPPPRRGGLFTSRKRAQLEARNAELNRLLVESGALDNAAIDAERHRLLHEVGALAAEADRRRADLAGLESRLQQVRAAIDTAEGEYELTEVGIYSFRHRLDDSIAYKERLDDLRARIKSLASAGFAVTGSTDWTVNGSAAQGRKMVKEFSKLMLRAYNADADHAVRTMRAYKLDSALARLDTTRTTIARLGATMLIAVSDNYHLLRKMELELTADYINKLAQEKERQRELRDQQREQQRADAEYAREQGRLERDRDKYADALARLEAAGETQKAIELRSQLTSVKAALDQLSYRRANMRLGWVYVISNIGAFGQRMVKIGMTRRVEPMDRVRELGDASVPFRFDVHALIFSEDAVTLETRLHQHFAAQKVNRVNHHREFFYVTPAEVRQALAELGSQYLVEYRDDVDAPEWRQSGGPERSLLPT